MIVIECIALLFLRAPTIPRRYLDMLSNKDRSPPVISLCIHRILKYHLVGKVISLVIVWMFFFFFFFFHLFLFLKKLIYAVLSGN